ncbi:membrane protein [Streptomyces ramulosus]
MALREEYAAGRGIPAGLTRSAGAARQWISDELTLSARNLTEHAAATRAAWLDSVHRGTLRTLWGAAAVLLLGQALTAVGSGWTAHRTATLTAAVALALGGTVTAWRHRGHGGVLAPLTGEDQRLSTSRTVAAGWFGVAVFAVLTAVAGNVLPGGAVPSPVAADGALSGRAALSPPMLLVLLTVCGTAVAARAVVAARVRAGRLQKPAAERPRAVDLFADDGGRADLAATQYLLVNAVVAALALTVVIGPPGLVRPSAGWVAAALVVVSAAGYLAAKCDEGGRPVILSVVRAREPGDLPAPIRPGDDIEIRGTGFVPPGARTPDLLSRIVVRIGTVHVPVPLVPGPGGFSSPADAALTVPVPADIEPGPTEIRVITASGAESAARVVEMGE